MKKILYSICLTSVVLASCVKDDVISQDSAAGVPVNVSISFQTKAAATPAPVVNSVRIIAFDSNGVCAINKLYTTGLTPADVADVWTVKITEELELTASTSKNYDLYAVINEDGNILSGTENTLTDLIEDNITEGSRTMNLFLSYFNSPVEYTETAATGTEPAFLMGAVASYTMSEGDSKTPANVQFSVIKRSLAQVTVNSITSQPASGDYSSTEIPKVFVLGVSLENVPSSAAWGTNSGSLKVSPTSIAVGSANSDGYYDRTWTGTVSQTVSVNTIKRETTDARYWRTHKDSNTGWSFSGPSFYYYNNDDKNAFEEAQKGPEKINERYEGQVVTLNTTDLPAVFSSPSNISGISYEVASLDSQGASSPSDGYWNVSLGQSFYIPENIASETGNETFVKVILAISNPQLDLSSMTAGDYPVPTSINEEDSELTWAYCINGYNIADASSKIIYGGKEKDKWIKQAFIDNGHVLASDASCTQGAEVWGKNGSKYYLAYVDGFSRRATGTADVVVDNTTAGIGLDWNVPTSGDNVYEFRIPVNNKAFDGDYSVRRNTKYSVTLHVTNETTFTKAGSGAGLGISATVTTEKMNENED